MWFRAAVFLAMLVASNTAKLAPRSSDFSADVPEIDYSKADFLDEIGARPDARAFQQASGMPLDESQFVVAANDALILPSAEHDGIPLPVEDWPVHPEDPVDSFEALRDRLTDAVETIFPERVDDYKESQRRANLGVKKQTPIADLSNKSSRTPSIMSEIEDLLAEVSHHGLAKGAEVSVEGEVPKLGYGQGSGDTCFWMLVGWMGSVSVFAVPAAILYLYVKCTGIEICKVGRPCCGHSPSHGGINNYPQSAQDDEREMEDAGGADYFVVHPYGDTNIMAAQYGLSYPAGSPANINDPLLTNPSGSVPVSGFYNYGH
ncbi:unnamed protein product [Notodromas monacha]|uniref:Uncharacterized protein n=1 Tax=Notodromas monacha TaxID=399045 RepID=A0A7R9BMG4_9CRUS|nr:unnamed protein product [Notodromas monacha]CAG0918207.1 unnamed protein product [Notodromas monacha]